MSHFFRALIPLGAVGAWLGCFASTAPAQVVVYDNLNTTNPTTGLAEPDRDLPVYGHALDLSQGGQLSFFGLTLSNSSDFSNIGFIITGTTTVKFYDNTIPYTSGSLSGSDPLLGTATINWDFTISPLNPGFFTTQTVDLRALNITLPPHIFVTQSFSQTTGNSNNNGVVLFSNPTVGNSPGNAYLMDISSEGLQNVGNNQIAYHVEVVPEPGCIALLWLAALTLVPRRRTAVTRGNGTGMQPIPFGT
jgi:hypothetical protein